MPSAIIGHEDLVATHQCSVCERAYGCTAVVNLFMELVCPSVYQGQWLCPRCAVKLEAE